MVAIEPFALEQWMLTYETKCQYNLAETCSAPISVNDLTSLSNGNNALSLSLSRKLTYGTILGSETLRKNVAALYADDGLPPLTADNVLITQGASMANFTLFYAVVKPGDHIICVYPTYAQLYSVPESFGADISYWRLQENKSFSLDLEDLKSLIKPSTKLIVLNNPNNPTGTTMSQSILEQVAKIADEHGIMVMSDEVYRPLFHTPELSAPDPLSIISLGYSKTVATGSLSKAFSMAGLRVGWIASRDPSIIQACAKVRDYSTISVSHLDDQIAAYALSPDVVRPLLDRNMKLGRNNLALLEKAVQELGRVCSWVKPTGGTTAFIKIMSNGQPVDDEEFCKRLIQQKGVMFSPACKVFGNSQDFKGYVRIGYACETEVLRDGLQKFKDFIRENRY